MAVTVLGVKNKALDPEQNEGVRRFTQRLVDLGYDGNVSAAAEALGVSQSLLYEFLKGTRGAGMKLLEGLADVTGASLDEVMGRPPPRPKPILRLIRGELANDNGDRYANRAKAAEAAQLIGLSGQAIAEVCADVLQSDEDPPVEWWLDQMRAANSRHRLGLRAPLGSRPITDAEADATRPKG
jgi:transcriptional regulator with XRE-family HTH domain